MTIATVAEALATLSPVDDAAARAADELSDRLTKPRGALGYVEELGRRLAAMSGTCPPPLPEPVIVCVFAADHGVVAQGVTPWPQEVTAQMVANFLGGGAAVNVLAGQIGARVLVVDVGVASPLPDAPGLLDCNVRRGTADLSNGPAMTPQEASAALDAGVRVAARAVGEGARLLVGGDMGIGNTTASAAVIAACTGRQAADVTGRGTGIDDRVLARKRAVVGAAVARLAVDADPLEVLAEVGGLEIAGLAGFMIGGAALGTPVVVDGVVGCAAALLATGLAPETNGYLIAGHRSVEPGAGAALEHLGLRPVLDLDLRLGEGTGAVLAVPIVQSAARILGEMATFDAAGVTDKDDSRR
jgi:nicotinate-nucleotide--dimethylbenzimidazole phosphoribosyltransferase